MRTRIPYVAGVCSPRPSSLPTISSKIRVQYDPTMFNSPTHLQSFSCHPLHQPQPRSRTAQVAQTPKAMAPSDMRLARTTKSLGKIASRSRPSLDGDITTCWLGLEQPQKNMKITISYLVGGFNHLDKYESMGRVIPYIMENQKCLKPPTSYVKCM